MSKGGGEREGSGIVGRFWRFDAAHPNVSLFTCTALFPVICAAVLGLGGFFVFYLLNLLGLLDMTTDRPRLTIIGLPMMGLAIALVAVSRYAFFEIRFDERTRERVRLFHAERPIIFLTVTGALFTLFVTAVSALDAFAVSYTLHLIGLFETTDLVRTTTFGFMIGGFFIAPWLVGSDLWHMWRFRPMKDDPALDKPGPDDDKRVY